MTAYRYLGALATLVVGAVHLQQYADFISQVPTIGELFVLNGIGAGVIVVLLATRLAPLAALGGIGLSAGALASVLVSMTQGGLFQYREASFRGPVVIAMAAEGAAVVLLAMYLVRSRSSSARSMSMAAAEG